MHAHVLNGLHAHVLNGLHAMACQVPSASSRKGQHLKQSMIIDIFCEGNVFEGPHLAEQTENSVLVNESSRARDIFGHIFRNRWDAGQQILLFRVLLIADAMRHEFE